MRALTPAHFPPPARRMKNVKMWALIGFVIALIIFFIVGFSCKWTLSPCGGS